MPALHMGFHFYQVQQQQDLELTHLLVKDCNIFGRDNLQFDD